MSSLVYCLGLALAIMAQLSSAQIFSPGSRNLGLGNGINGVARNGGGNYANLGTRGQNVNGKSGIISSNCADSNSGRVTGTIATRVVSGNCDNLRSRLNKDFGVQVLAETLSVDGNVDINGKLPFIGVVAINGNVPTEGTGSVNYGCGCENNINVNRLS